VEFSKALLGVDAAFDRSVILLQDICSSTALVGAAVRPSVLAALTSAPSRNG
jgi:hypothetical protein